MKKKPAKSNYKSAFIFIIIMIIVFFGLSYIFSRILEESISAESLKADKYRIAITKVDEYLTIDDLSVLSRNDFVGLKSFLTLPLSITGVGNNNLFNLPILDESLINPLLISQ